jgi:hypothetical protein
MKKLETIPSLLLDESMLNSIFVDISIKLHYYIHNPHGNLLSKGDVDNVGYNGDFNLTPNIRHKLKNGNFARIFCYAANSNLS